MADKRRFSSDIINLYIIVIDSSGSMDKHRSEVIAGLKEIKRRISATVEVNSIAICIVKFKNNVYIGDFKDVEDMDTDNYHPEGGTELYLAISKSADRFLDYHKIVEEENKCKVQSSFIVMTDGEDSSYSSRKYNDAIEWIEKMKKNGFTVALVPYGEAITSLKIRNMGFTDIMEVKGNEKMSEILGKRVSESIRRQSQCSTSLSGNFFGNSSQRNGKSLKSLTPKNLGSMSQAILEDNEFFGM